MRRPEFVDLMLFATVTLWALNFTVTKYVISHGFRPVAYGCVRFGAAAVVFSGLVYAREGSVRVARRDFGILVIAALVGIFLNQLTFVYAIKLTTATTVALLFGTLPVLTGLLSRILGIDALTTRFWLAALLAFGGAALVAVGGGGGVSGDLLGDLLGFAATATWAFYSVAIAPLVGRYTPLRVSAIAFALGSIPLFAVGAPQLAAQNYDFGPRIWLAYVFAVFGPLVVANLLWFGAIGRVGPSRASVFANLQPFLAAIFALLILSESMTRLQVAGGLAIAAGILLSRPGVRKPEPAAAASVSE
jgi:drug/metabolite transporter (DMT)-like permease